VVTATWSRVGQPEKERQDGGAAYAVQTSTSSSAVRSDQVHLDRADGVVGGELGQVVGELAGSCEALSPSSANAGHG
jgi:hypothetical protein